GVEHETKLNPVETKVGTLAPGATQTVPLALTPRQTGALTATVTARADGGLTDSSRQTVTVKRAAVSVRNNGPTWRYVGRPADWTVIVENTGELPLTNVLVRDALPPELTFQSASEGGTAKGNQVTWPAGNLKPGEKRVLSLTTVCQALTPRAMTVVSVTADP